MEFVFIDEIFFVLFQVSGCFSRPQLCQRLMDEVNSKSNSFQTCADRIVWALTTKKSVAQKTIQSQPNLWKTCATSQRSLYLPVCLLQWNGSINCNLFLIQNVQFFSLVLQVYMCIGIPVAVWYQLKFGSELLLQLLGWFDFSFVSVEAEREKTEGEGWKGKF